MTIDLEYEKNFIAMVDQFEPEYQDLSEILKQLGQWRINLSKGLEHCKINNTQLNKKSYLTQQIQAVHTAIQTHIKSWGTQWENLKPAQEFAETFDDKLILLVYGKFNAGKSSFCNFLAERFSKYDFSIQYFQLNAGRVVMSAHVFKEGVTETTAQLQGVILGSKLVLVDTPGLHSATKENSELTTRFTDSADGVLWLSSSASPGQVQELDELARELNRRKPLLPVLTRSDFIEEDEVDGEIEKTLRNKTTENRQLQEQDVKSRALEKLTQMGIAVTQLKTPLSVSVRAAQAIDSTSSTFSDAGFERLYKALLDLIEPVILYKRRKSVEMLLHHLEENVIGGLSTELLPQLDALSDVLNAEQIRLQQSEEPLMSAVWRGLIPLVPEILDKHEAADDVQAACKELTQELLVVLRKQIQVYLSDYLIELEDDAVVLQVTERVGYEQVMVDGVVAGVSHDALHTALEKAVHTQLKHQVSQLIEQSELVTQALLDETQAIRELLVLHTQQLNSIKLYSFYTEVDKVR